MTAEERLVDDARRYGLVIAPIAGRLLGLHTQRANRMLEGLVRAGPLWRFRFEGASYFRVERQPLAFSELRRRFAVSWLCHMSTPAVELLRAEDVRDVLSPLLPHLGIAGVRNMPAHANPITRRLSVIVVAREDVPSGDLQHTLDALQQVVAARWFRPWLFLSASDQAELTYLHPRGDEIPELERWLAMHPLYGRFEEGVPAARVLPKAIAVSVRIAPLVTLMREPEKTKAHEGLLSPATRRATG